MNQPDPDTRPNKIMTHGPIRSLHVDQRDPDTWANQIATRRCPYACIHVSIQRTKPRQQPAWLQNTSAASMAPSHVSCQHARCHVAVTSMTKLVTMFTSHRRWEVPWRKTCPSLKRSSSMTKMADSSRCDKCDTLSMTITKTSQIPHRSFSMTNLTRSVTKVFCHGCEHFY
jgi:hypothetical protein